MDIVIDDMHSLTCPKCSSSTLHQKAVKVFFRHGEDVKTGRFLKCSTEGVHEISGDDNPSARRDGLLIKFECELCDADPELSIIQHKGSTYIEWHSMRAPLEKFV